MTASYHTVVRFHHALPVDDPPIGPDAVIVLKISRYVVFTVGMMPVMPVSCTGR